MAFDQQVVQLAESFFFFWGGKKSCDVISGYLGCHVLYSYLDGCYPISDIYLARESRYWEKHNYFIITA